jgi:hypothetical protein
MIGKMEYKSLKQDNCFGIRSSTGLRLVAESTGDPYGLRGFDTPPGGQRRDKVMIGFLYSEFAFRLQGRALPRGAYTVFVFRDALELSGDDSSSMHYDIPRQENIPKDKTEEFPLKTALPEALLTEKASEVPRFSLTPKGGSAMLVIHGNSLTLTPDERGQAQPIVSLKKVLSAKQIKLLPLASRFDVKGKRAVVVEVDLSGPDRAVVISSADFAFQYKADGTERMVPCVGLYKRFGIWDLASQGPVTDERNFSQKPNQQLLFLVPTDVTQGHVVRTASNEALEVKAILSGK